MPGEKLKVEWNCPRCGAKPNECGRPEKAERGVCGGKHCMGFLCNCDGDTPPEHGETYDHPCTEAGCGHCGWGGTFPKMPGKWPTWTKKALAAGWTPPEGWQPSLT